MGWEFMGSEDRATMVDVSTCCAPCCAVLCRFVQRGNAHVARTAEREILNQRLLVMHPNIVQLKEVADDHPFNCKTSMIVCQRRAHLSLTPLPAEQHK
jgi:hypothetical protein